MIMMSEFRCILGIAILVLFQEIQVGQCCITQQFSNENSVVKLSCSILSFSGTGSWSVDGGAAKTNCAPSTFCTTTVDGNYSFTSDSAGIYVKIDPFSSDEIGKLWKCENAPSFNCTITVSGPPASLISATPSSEITAGIESSFSDVTGTVEDEISDVLPSFKNTDFKPSTSLAANVLSLGDTILTTFDSYFPVSTNGSVLPTETPTYEYFTTDIGMDSSLFSQNILNITDETIKSGLPTTIITSTRNKLFISSESVLDLDTVVSMKDDSQQNKDIYVTSSENIVKTETFYTSLLTYVSLSTKKSNVQTDPVSIIYISGNDAQSIDTVPLQSTLSSFTISSYTQDSLSISRTVESFDISANQVTPSSESPLIRSFISSFDTLTIEQNVLYADESISSMVAKSLHVSTDNPVPSLSGVLSDSQFLQFLHTSDSHQPEFVATSSVNPFTQADSLSETLTFTMVNPSSTLSSYYNDFSTAPSSNSFETSLNVLSVDTSPFRQNGQSSSLSLSTNSSIHVDFSATEHFFKTSFVSSVIQLISTPLNTSIPIVLGTSYLSQFSTVSDPSFETSSVSVQIAKVIKSSSFHEFSLLTPTLALSVSSYKDFSTFSEISSETINHLVTSDTSSIQSSQSLYAVSSQPTSRTTQTPAISFFEAQIVVFSCSIAAVILVIFVPLMIMYHLRKLPPPKIYKEKYENDGLSSLSFPQNFNRHLVNDVPSMGNFLPLRHHARRLSDLPYSWDFENNWNNLTC